MSRQSAAGGIGQGEHAAHALHRLVDDGEAQPGPGCLGTRRIAAEEGLHQVGQGLGGHTRAMVTHLDHHPVGAGPRGNLHPCQARPGAAPIAAGVLQQIGQHPHEVHLVGLHLQRWRYIERHHQVVLLAHRCDACAQDRGQPHGPQRAGVGAGVVEELVDDGVELVDVGGHHLAGVGVGHAQFGLQPQPCERRAQVVRDARQHHCPVLIDLGELGGHPVEADVDLPDLAGHRILVEPAGVEVAIAHAAGSEGQLLERPVDQARNQRCAGE